MDVKVTDNETPRLKAESAPTGDPLGGSGPRSRAVVQVAKVTRDQRVTDFMVLLSSAVVVLAGISLTGEMSFLAVSVAGLVIVGFGVIYFSSTAHNDSIASRSLREAAEAEERQMRVANERAFRAEMISALAEPSMYIDGRGRVEAANAAARQTFHFVAPEPLLTMVVRRAELLDAVANVQGGGEASRFDLMMRDQIDRYFSGVAAPVETLEGPGVLVTMHDLTEIKRAEFARVDFLANASHELRTPLSSLTGFIETLKGPARDDPEARERFLGIMEGQAERMNRMISDLLSLSRIELIEYRTPDTRADIAAVAVEVCAALGPVAQARDVSLVIDGPESGLSVAGAHDELVQVIQNLIDNAIKYSEPGDEVTIQLRAGLGHAQAFAVAGRSWENAGRMTVVGNTVAAGGGTFSTVRVVDKGPGISRQHLPRLAERFYRVEPARSERPGTGLGLAIVKHIVTRHRGDLVVESEAGRGSAFGVVLPEKSSASPYWRPETAGVVS